MQGNVCYVLDSFPASSETFVSNEILELLRRGVDVRIVSLHRPDSSTVFHPGVEALRTRVTYLDEKPLYQRVLRATSTLIHQPKGLLRTWKLAAALGSTYRWMFRRAFPLIDAIRSSACSRVHIHFGGPALEYAVLACSVLGKPYTVTLHGSDIFLRPLQALPELCRKAHRVITVSDFNRRYLHTEFGIPTNTVDVVTCGVDTRFFTPPANQKWRVAGRIVTVARLSPEKGHIYLLQAASILKSAGFEFEWRMIGDGPLRQQLESQAAEAGLSKNVVFCGARDAYGVLEELQHSVVFALGSTSEAAPVSYFEAMATETPVVGTRVRGVPEFVLEGETGLLVTAADPDALAERIGILLKDPELAHRLGRCGRRHVIEHLSLKAQVDGLMRAWTGASQDRRLERSNKS